MRRKKATFTELTLKGILLFSIFNVLQGVEVFDSINRIWIVAISTALLVCLLQYSYTKTQLLMLCLTGIIHVIALYFTDFPLVNTNMLFYFLIWVILYFFFTKSKEKIMRIMQTSDIYINLVLGSWTLLIGVTAFIPSCYVNRYFYSLAGSSFRLLPATLIIAALAMYMTIKKANSRYLLFLVMPTYAAFMNRSRTYFVIYICMLVMFAFMYFKTKRNFYLFLIPFCVIVLVLIAITGIVDKIESTRYTERSYFDFWGTFTNGRSIFWKTDLQAFFALPFWQQFVGNGFDFVYEVNAASFAEIWAHNDIINLLMNFGYIGVIIYIWVFAQMLKVFWRKGDSIPRFVKLCFLGTVFFNSMVNMSYTYICAMISYALFLCVIDQRYNQKNIAPVK